MFRSFRNLPGKYSAPAKNIIIYVGDAHADDYRNFLNTIGFREINSVKSETQCLSMQKFKLPFFSP